MSKENAINTKRIYTGFLGSAFRAFTFLMALFQLLAVTIGAMPAVEIRIIHTFFLFASALIFFPAYKKEEKERALPPFYDIILLALAVLSLGYVYINFSGRAMAGGLLSQSDIIMAGIIVILLFTVGLRTSKSLTILAGIFLLYNFLGQFIPGVLGHGGFSIKRVLGHLVWGTNGLFGVGAGVSATYILVFVIFASFLQKSGFSELINDIALALVGRTAGGPAKISVLSSALFGMINGSAVANVTTDGCITIPLMKKIGLRPEYAAAVEAAASTGGQFMPPIMGAVGFVMAEFMGVGYATVMLAALVPAFLYYLALFLSVHFEAKKMGLKGISKENIPNVSAVLKKKGHLLMPLLVLIIMLLLGFTPVYSTVIAMAFVIISSALKKETRMSMGDIYSAFYEGAVSAISVGVSCIMIGVIIGTVSLTGVGLTFGRIMLGTAGEGKLLLTGLLAMVMCIILGMGVPGVAAYVIVSAVAVPALCTAGASQIAAHLFCLIYACLANITPPVAISSYAAAGIAGAKNTETSLIAMRIGFVGFILPLTFLFNDALLIGSGAPLWECIGGIISAIFGTFALSAGFEGELFGKTGLLVRGALLASALLCIIPETVTDILGISLFALVLLYQYKGKIKGELK